MACDSFELTFNNSQCVEMRGCVLYGYKNGVKVDQDGVKPVPTQDNIRFRVSSPGMTHWRFIGAVDYSDNPENADVVLVDTKQRPMDKCARSITCSTSASTSSAAAPDSSNSGSYDIS